MAGTVVAEGAKFRVRLDNGELARGRFHTTAQAEAWIAAQREKAEDCETRPPRAPMRGRDRAYLLASRDYYGDNERSIRRITVTLDELKRRRLDSTGLGVR